MKTREESGRCGGEVRGAMCRSVDSVSCPIEMMKEWESEATDPLDRGLETCTRGHEARMVAAKTGAAILPRKRRLASRHLTARLFGHTTELIGEWFIG